MIVTRTFRIDRRGSPKELNSILRNLREDQLIDFQAVRRGQDTIEVTLTYDSLVRFHVLETHPRTSSILPYVAKPDAVALVFSAPVDTGNIELRFNEVAIADNLLTFDDSRTVIEIDVSALSSNSGEYYLDGRVKSNRGEWITSNCLAAYSLVPSTPLSPGDELPHYQDENSLSCIYQIVAITENMTKVVTAIVARTQITHDDIVRIVVSPKSIEENALFILYKQRNPPRITRLDPGHGAVLASGISQYGKIGFDTRMDTSDAVDIYIDSILVTGNLQPSLTDYKFPLDTAIGTHLIEYKSIKARSGVTRTLPIVSTYTIVTFQGGAGDVDLSDYYTQSETDALFTPYYTSAEINAILQEYYTVNEVDVILKDYYTQVEVDGLFTTHLNTYNHDNYDTAYNWGDHVGLYEATGNLTTHITSDDHDDRYYTEPEIDGILTGYAGTGDIPFTHPNEPNGFLVPGGEAPDTTITWNDGAGTITIAPVGSEFTVYSEGTEIIYTAGSPLIITMTETEGIHWVYVEYDGTIVVTDGNPLWSIFEKYCTVCHYYWDADANASIIRGDERHGIQMDGAIHRYDHETVGTVWEHGLAINGYTLQTDTDNAIRIGWSEGEIHDEDIDFDISAGSHPATVAVFYRKGVSTWRRKTPDTFPYLQPGISDYPSGTYPAYNDENGGTWKLTDIGNNNYVNMWVCATTDLFYPIITIPSQSFKGTLADAQEENFSDLNLSGLPFPELKLIWKITYRSRSIYSNTDKCRIEEVIDFRAAQLIGSSGYIPVDHGSLSGLITSGHPADIISVTPDSFTGHLNTGDITVQIALETIDLIPAGVTSLEGLDDTVVTAPSNGDYLRWNGGEWVNEDPEDRFAETGDLATIDHNILVNYEVNEHLDWTQDLGATNIHEGNIPVTTGNYQPLDPVLTNIADLTLSKGDILWYDSANMVQLPAGTEKQTLRQGSADVPVWVDVQHLIEFTFPGALSTGDENPWYSFFLGTNIEITSVYAVLKTGPTSEVSIEIEKCTQSNIDGTPSWISIFNTVLTIDPGELSSNSAVTPAVFHGTNQILGDGDHLRFRVIDIGTDGTDLSLRVIGKEV